MLEVSIKLPSISFISVYENAITGLCFLLPALTHPEGIYQRNQLILRIYSTVIITDRMAQNSKLALQKPTDLQTILYLKDKGEDHFELQEKIITEKKI